jgi:hypothetical protein
LTVVQWVPPADDDSTLGRAKTAKTYIADMPISKFMPCIPIRATKVPAGPDWFHEIKFDGFRMFVERCHLNDFIARAIAGCFRFLTLIQCGDLPPRVF